MIIKLAALLAVLFLVYIVFFKKNRENINSNKKQNDTLEDIMEECPTCGTFVSKNEAIISSGKYFCSKECVK
jgi:uncharacterized protein